MRMFRYLLCVAAIGLSVLGTEAFAHAAGVGEEMEETEEGDLLRNSTQRRKFSREGNSLPFACRKYAYRV